MIYSHKGIIEANVNLFDDLKRLLNRVYSFQQKCMQIRGGLTFSMSGSSHGFP